MMVWYDSLYLRKTSSLSSGSLSKTIGLSLTSSLGIKYFLATHRGGSRSSTCSARLSCNGRPPVDDRGGDGSVVLVVATVAGRGERPPVDDRGGDGSVVLVVATAAGRGGRAPVDDRGGDGSVVLVVATVAGRGGRAPVDDRGGDGSVVLVVAAVAGRGGRAPVDDRGGDGSVVLVVATVAGRGERVGGGRMSLLVFVTERIGRGGCLQVPGCSTTLSLAEPGFGGIGGGLFPALILNGRDRSCLEALHVDWIHCSVRVCVAALGLLLLAVVRATGSMVLFEF